MDIAGAYAHGMMDSHPYVDGEIHAFHVLFPVTMARNRVRYDRMQTASHRVGLSAMPEIVNYGY